MMKKLLLKLFKNTKIKHKQCFTFLLLLFASLYTSAQSTTNLADGHTFSTRTVSSEINNLQDVNISWDFTQVRNRQQIELSIEIQPLNACWDGLNGTIRSEKTTRQIHDFSEAFQGNLTLSFYELNSKCFKWRAKIATDAGTNYTAWEFSSFL